MRRAWLFLFIGIFVEMVGTTGMRALVYDHPALSQLSATSGIVISYFLVSRSVEVIPIGIAYAIWSGMGIGGVSILSWLFFAEAMPPIKIFGLVLVIIGMIIVNLEKSGKIAAHQEGNPYA